MPEEQIYANVEKIRSMSRRLAKFSTSLDEEIGKLRSGVEYLSNRWKDQQFKEFKDHFDGTALVLKEFLRRIDAVRPSLEQDAKRLEEYQNVNLNP